MRHKQKQHSIHHIQHLISFEGSLDKMSEITRSFMFWTLNILKNLHWMKTISTQVSELQEHILPNNTFHSCCIHIHIHQPQMISKHVIHENSTYDIHNLDILHRWFLQCNTSSKIQHLKGKNTLSFVHLFTICTMLQKLSKCEVKVWLCWNLIILLTWDQILANSNGPKYQFWQF